ncbi:hypothetical protein B0H10DRAFT_2214735 [Mycena sp. CBHHK59/15]|nr:hypothetical protein B0H10DRAFT_2214735 [Mycena sp. CBHHK59/15]
MPLIRRERLGNRTVSGRASSSVRYHPYGSASGSRVSLASGDCAHLDPSGDLAGDGAGSGREIHRINGNVITFASPPIGQTSGNGHMVAFHRTRLRNRLTFKKTGQMSKVGAAIRREHVAAGFVDPREKRKNHDDGHVANLIAVPQYADILEHDEASDEDEEEHISSRLVNSRSAWRKLHASWMVMARQEEMAAESAGGTPTPDGDVPAPPPPGRSSKWLPCSLAKLFGGQIPQPPTRAPRRAFTREELLMELLAAEHSDEEPDDGELEGSGDDYEGD